MDTRPRQELVPFCKNRSNKKALHPNTGTKGLRGTTLLATKKWPLWYALTGAPRRRLLTVHRQSLPIRAAGEFSQCFIPVLYGHRTGLTPLSPGSLVDGLLLLHRPLVDPEGFEPSTFSMPLRRAPNCAMGPVCNQICDGIVLVIR